MALTLADVWNLHTDGRAVIAGQGSTPRAALPLAGHGACLANGRPVIAISYSTETGGWETNPDCYRRPDYLKDRNTRSWWEASDGRWLGHPIASAGEIRSSAPFSGFETDALKAMIEREPLGADETTDLLLVNLKTPDYVGHQYGPDSPELAAALTALDHDLAGVIAALEAKVGPRYVLAFTADHGMPPEPDGRRSQQRVYSEDIVKLIHDALDPERGRLVRLYPPEDMQLTVDRTRLRELGLELGAVRRILEAQPFIFAAFTEDEVRAASAKLGGCDGGRR
jgi:predicted AlkP superfamily pyrophosphatase or phosphodiesterase